MIGSDSGATLTPVMWEALHGAGDVLIDSYCDDLAHLSTGGAFDATFMSSDLPRRYLARYDYLFAKRFFTCLVTVVWKLGAPEQYDLACVAEEMALHALIEQATMDLERRGVEADFGDFCDDAFQDLDFLWLFDPKYDGIEDSPEGAFLGVGNLHFDEWFTPFLNVLYVHPYASGISPALPPSELADDETEDDPPSAGPSGPGR